MSRPGPERSESEPTAAETLSEEAQKVRERLRRGEYRVDLETLADTLLANDFDETGQ